MREAAWAFGKKLILDAEKPHGIEGFVSFSRRLFRHEACHQSASRRYAFGGAVLGFRNG
jgi:hypothetical protein